jgi:hypothetical protein
MSEEKIKSEVYAELQGGQALHVSSTDCVIDRVYFSYGGNVIASCSYDELNKTISTAMAHNERIKKRKLIDSQKEQK